MQAEDATNIYVRGNLPSCPGTQKGTHMRPQLILFVVLGVLAGGLAGLVIMGSNGALVLQTPQQNTSGKALIGGPFSLVNHEGKRVSDKDFRGKKMLIYFGFTHCPDICPGSLQVISSALDKLGPAADTITPIFITVDPERDTPKLLRAYVASFHPRLVGLTGEKENVDNVVKKTFRVYAKKVEDPDQPGNYTMDHASLIYLMDENGKFVHYFPHPTSADKLAEQLRAYL